MAYRQKDVQLSLNSFGIVLVTPLSPENEWVTLANQIPWQKLEEAYQLAFPSKLGRATKPFRQIHGAELIKQRTGLSDRELVGAIRDTPAYQYFMGLPVYRVKAPFTFSSLSYFRRRIVSISELLLNHVHGVNNRFVSLSQPEVCPIVRGKAKSSVLKLMAQLPMVLWMWSAARLITSTKASTSANP